MRRFIIFLLLITFSAGYSYAQGPANNAQKQRFEQFRAEKKAYLTQEIGLTPAEQKLFFPLYDEYQYKKFKLGRETRMKVRDIGRSQSKVSEAEYKAVADAMVELPVKEALLDKEYYERFSKFLSPEKLFLYRKAELTFSKKILNDRQKAANRKR